MAVIGIHHVLVETHSWTDSLKFWCELGWTLVEDHGTSGRLTGPGGGAYIWLNQVARDEPLAVNVYFDLDATAFTPASPLEVVEPLAWTHWGTQVMSVRDPDGRIVRLQAT